MGPWPSCSRPVDPYAGTASAGVGRRGVPPRGRVPRASPAADGIAVAPEAAPAGTSGVAPPAVVVGARLGGTDDETPEDTDVPAAGTGGGNGLDGATEGVRGEAPAGQAATAGDFAPGTAVAGGAPGPDEETAEEVAAVPEAGGEVMGVDEDEPDEG